MTGNHAVAEVIEEGTVLVTEKRREVSEIDPIRTPLAMERISLAPYQARSMSLEEVLDKKAGVQIRRLGGPGAHSTVSLRGSTTSQVAVFIDGIPLNRGARSEVDLSKYSLDNLEAIEVYRGMAPARFGVSPIGGVVNLVTRPAAKRTSGHAKVEAGSFGTLGGAMEVGLGNRDWSLLLDADKLHSDGDYEYVDDRRTPNDPSDDITKTRLNNDMTREGWMLKAGLPGAGTNRLDLMHQFNEKDQGLPGRGSNQTLNTRYSTIEHVNHMGHTWHGVGVAGSDLALKLSHSDAREHYSDLSGPSGELGLGRQDNHYHIVQKGGHLAWERILDGHLLEVDYGYSREDYSAVEEFSAIQPGASSRAGHSLALQDQMDFSRGRWLVVPALKGLASRNDYGDTTGLGAVAGRSFGHESLDAQLGIRRLVKSDLEWRGNIGSASREPSFHELFGDRGNRVGNPVLEDEHSLNWDTNIMYTPKCENRVLTKPWVSFGYFASHQQDLIQMVFDARGVGRAENISRTLIQGIELESGVAIGRRLDLQQQLTWVSSRIEESRFPGEAGNQVPGVYERTWTGRAAYDFGRFGLYTELLIQRDMYYDRTNLLQAADKEVVNVGLKTKVKKLEAHAEVKNLGDDQIEDYSGWPLPGRSYHFTMLATF